MEERKKNLVNWLMHKNLLTRKMTEEEKLKDEDNYLVLLVKNLQTR